jgi:hypothetical protein
LWNTTQRLLISTNKAKLNVGMIHDYLANSSCGPRAGGRGGEVYPELIVFGLYAQPADWFARVVTDCATFAWLCDVFIIEDYRRQGRQMAGRVRHTAPGLQGCGG